MSTGSNIFKIGIDLGGTKAEGIILDNEMNEIFRKRIPTDQDKGYYQILDDLKDLYFEMIDKIENKQNTFGIGTPGSISHKTGLMKNCNIVSMNERAFDKDLEKKISRKFALENDSNCFAIAEAKLGAGKGKKRVFGAIMGTGVGGGYIAKGKLVPGLQSLAGEWGHSIIDSTGIKCYCGKVGCVETFISGTGVENRYCGMYLEKIAMNEIVKKYRLGDEKAKVVMAEFFDYFGKAISNLINILDPDIIVLGGGLSNIEELYVLGIDKVKHYVFNDEMVTPIVRNKLGDSAGGLGAALIGK